MFVLKLFPLDCEGNEEPVCYLWINEGCAAFERFQYKDNPKEATSFSDKSELTNLGTLLIQDYWYDENCGPTWGGFQIIDVNTSHNISNEELREFVSYMRKIRMGPCVDQILGTMLNRPHGIS